MDCVVLGAVGRSTRSSVAWSCCLCLVDLELLMTERALRPAKKVLRTSTICQWEKVNFVVEVPAFRNVAPMIDLEMVWTSRPLPQEGIPESSRNREIISESGASVSV